MLQKVETSVKSFKTPRDSIGDLDPETAAALISAAADVALVVGVDGIIQDLAFQHADLGIELESFGKWSGRQWRETVTPDSQHKVEALIKEAGKQKGSGWRQLTYQTVQGSDVPILYSAVRLGESDRIVALGRDLRSVTALQQRLVDTQMSMERDYARLRFAETRYRILFQTSLEPVIVLDASTNKIVEANPAATALLETRGKGSVRSFGEIFDQTSRTQVQAFLSHVKKGSRVEDVKARLTNGADVNVSGSLFRQNATSLLLLRITPAKVVAPPVHSDDDAALTTFVRDAPDGFVLADATGRIIAANSSFASMVQVSVSDLTRDGRLERWFGRPGVDFEVIVSNLRQHGSVRRFKTTLNGENGATVDVEASAIAIADGRFERFGFSIRDVGHHSSNAPSRPQQNLPHSAAQLTELIGRVPLKDLVRETTDVIEKLCIETALELTGDNRASAAEMLGLSRQSLYVKLRRFGLDDAVPDDEP